MDCFKTASDLEGFKHPSRKKAIPNEEEEIFVILENIFGPERDRLLEEGWNLDLKGNKDSLFFYKAANIYIYLSHLIVIIYNYKKIEKTLGKCVDSKVYETFKIDCIKNQLQCLSVNNKTPYINLWNKALIETGVEINCNCCSGIDSMVIGDKNCLGFIINKCNNSIDECPLTEFLKEEFNCNEFV